MHFDITPTAPTPIYRQIVEQVHRMVASAQLRPGDYLPSVRAVALHHAINPMTVSKAYSLLETEGLVARVRGLGMVIAEARGKSGKQEKAAMLRPALDAAAAMARQLGLSDADAIALFQSSLKQTSIKDNNEND
ncbi:MAG: GntR family transcriptional regulator [Pseudomonadota bacterium]|nr:GntR family transcriptional regulator [Pseudomonadota bacterium]